MVFIGDLNLWFRLHLLAPRNPFVRQEKLRVGVLAIKYHELAEPLDAPPLRLGVCLGQQAMEMNASLLEACELFELAGRLVHERQASRRRPCKPTQYSLFETADVAVQSEDGGMHVSSPVSMAVHWLVGTCCVCCTFGWLGLSQFVPGGHLEHTLIAWLTLCLARPFVRIA
jgi:hypothetical protein